MTEISLSHEGGGIRDAWYRCGAPGARLSGIWCSAWAMVYAETRICGVQGGRESLDLLAFRKLTADPRIPESSPRVAQQVAHQPPVRRQEISVEADKIDAQKSFFCLRQMVHTVFRNRHPCVHEIEMGRAITNRAESLPRSFVYREIPG